MAFHDRRIHEKRAVTFVSDKRRDLILKGARSINLWSRLEPPAIGDVGDDWKATGDDIRSAMLEFEEERG
jgi:hypothetical protein